MRESLYGELTPWYRLLDPLEDHEEEAAHYLALLGARARGELLELGSGAGNNAYYLRRALACTLVDRAPAMLDLSRALNPECAHVEGDMRTVRLGRAFDVVLVHDAIAYMRTEAEVAAALATVAAHLRPGGAALIAPDCVRETFREHRELHEGADAARALCVASWMWDPEPSDTEYVVDYAFMLREGGAVRVVHDRHHEGLFSRADWVRLAAAAGLDARWCARPGIEPDDVYVPELLWAEPLTPR